MKSKKLKKPLKIKHEAQQPDVDVDMGPTKEQHSPNKLEAKPAVKNAGDEYGTTAPKDLPVAEAKDRLLEEIRRNAALIVLGETASGKTTQIPQYILDAGLNKGKTIAVTQPRRVAAISIAKRVAWERDDKVGHTVGYSVRFDEKTSKNTQLKYMTDGMLLREAMRDRLLSQYSYVILDEAHERTLNTDVLLGILKEAQKVRGYSNKCKTSLKIIIMSATIDADNMQYYFDNSKVVYIEGRQHPVKIFTPLTSPDELFFSTISLIINFHWNSSSEDHILVFLTGQDEIKALVHYLRRMRLANLEVLPLYAALSHEAQLRAITKPLEGVRRVIVSTNIAETSLTIPGVRIVIDSGVVKTKVHYNQLAIDSLQIVKVSKAQAMQRAGRAGREKPGECYRLYTKDEYNAMPPFNVPEILRSNISGVILHLLKIGIDNPSSFDWLDPPQEEALYAGSRELYELGAIHQNQEPLELTNLGKIMAGAPLSPEHAKVLVTSLRFYLLEPVASILGVLSSDSIFQECKRSVEVARARFYSPEGDLITYLNVLREFRRSKSKVMMCKAYKFNFRALSYAVKVRAHLIQYCISTYPDYEVKIHKSDSQDLSEGVRKLFFRCLPSNIATLENGNVYRTRRTERECLQVNIHPSSALMNKKAKTLHFTEVTQLAAGKHYINHISLIDSTWLNLPRL